MRHIRIKIAAILFLVSFCAPAFCEEEAPKENTDQNIAAEVAWSTDTPSTSQVEFTQDPLQGYDRLTTLDKTLVTYHRVVLKGLKSGTEYHYRVKSADGTGRESIGDDAVLVVPGAESNEAPKISGVAVKNVVAIPNVRAPKVPPEAPSAEIKEEASPTPKEIKPELKDAVSKELPVQEILIEHGGLLLPPGKFQIEPDFTYAHTSSNKIVVNGLAILPILVIGEINTQEISRDIFIPALTVRAGIFRDLQASFRMPYRYEFDRVSDTSNTETTNSSGGMGDLEGGLSFQILREQAILPAAIVSTTVKADNGRDPYGREIGLGTGYWSLRNNLVLVKSVDPATIFANVGYTVNFDNTFDNFGRVEPGNTIDYSVGLAFALNYQTALNFQFEDLITGTTKLNGADVAGSFVNAAMFKAGFTYSISKNWAIDLVCGMGVSKDAPDFTVDVRLPVTF